jgi:hypothetical protein
VGPIIFGASRQQKDELNDDATAAFQRLLNLPIDDLKAQISRDEASSGHSSNPLSRNGSSSNRSRPITVLPAVGL